MNYSDANIGNGRIYNLGANLGFFISFLLFTSVFYFVMIKLNKIPTYIKYHHVIIFVITIYLIGLIVAKVKDNYKKSFRNKPSAKNSNPKLEFFDYKLFYLGFKRGFKNFSYSITDIFNFILLFFVYFIGIAAVSLISRLISKHFLDLSNKGSSWITKKLSAKPIEEYCRSF